MTALDLRSAPARMTDPRAGRDPDQLDVCLRQSDRRRFLDELHDSLGPRLAAVVLQLEVIRRLEGQDRLQLLEASTAELRACVCEVRRLAADLRPAEMT